MEKIEQGAMKSDGNYKPKCFNPYCNKKPIFEGWDGWQWCFRDWLREVKSQDHKWFYLKNTRLRSLK